MRCLVLPSSARCLLHAACCVLPRCLGACCQWSFPKFLLHAARCPLHAACCMLRCTTVLSAACCLKSGACCLLRVACFLFAAYCPLHGACCLEVVCCTLRVVGCMFPVACCVSSVTFSPMQVACCQLSVAQFPVVICGTLSVGSCRMHVASCSFSGARPSVRCRMSVARSHVCISSRCTVCVASRPSHVADRTFPVASCLLCVACPILHDICWMLQNARSPLLLVSCPCRSHSGTSSVACRRLQRCRATQRRRIRSASRRRIAIERLSGRQDPLQTEVCVRACVRACVHVGG